MRSLPFPAGGRTGSRPDLRLRYFRVGGSLPTRDHTFLPGTVMDGVELHAALPRDLRTAPLTSFALPVAIPTCPLPSPTATRALKLKRRPPFTTLATRLIATTFSIMPSPSRPRSPPSRLSPPRPLPRPPRPPPPPPPPPPRGPRGGRCSSAGAVGAAPAAGAAVASGAGALSVFGASWFS